MEFQRGGRADGVLEGRVGGIRYKGSRERPAFRPVTCPVSRETGLVSNVMLRVVSWQMNVWLSRESMLDPRKCA